MAQRVLVGGTSDVKIPDENVNQICQKMKSKVEEDVKETFDEFTPVHYKTQVVAGTNYFIKVRVNVDKHLHIRVHRSLQGEFTLAAVQQEKSLEDELKYF